MAGRKSRAKVNWSRFSVFWQPLSNEEPPVNASPSGQSLVCRKARARLFMLTTSLTVDQVVEQLILIAGGSLDNEWRDGIWYLPIA
jgi:hypothetical protein